MFVDRVIHFGETLGDQVKGRSPKKLKSLTQIPYVVHVKVKGRLPKKQKSLIEVLYVLQVKEHVLSFNMILISSP